MVAPDVLLVANYTTVVIYAATLMTSAPLLIAFLLFQRQFVQSFMRGGIRLSCLRKSSRVQPSTSCHDNATPRGKLIG